MIKLKFAPLEFPNLSTSSVTLTVVKMASQVSQFLISILEEDGPDDMLFQQGGAPLGSGGFLKSQVSREMDWQGWAYHLATSFA
jgi:hypothetical protein